MRVMTIVYIKDPKLFVLGPPLADKDIVGHFWQSCHCSASSAVFCLHQTPPRVTPFPLAVEQSDKKTDALDERYMEVLEQFKSLWPESYLCSNTLYIYVLIMWLISSLFCPQFSIWLWGEARLPHLRPAEQRSLLPAPDLLPHQPAPAPTSSIPAPHGLPHPLTLPHPQPSRFQLYLLPDLWPRR